MALTLTQIKCGRGQSGQFSEAIYDIQFDNSYPTGGYAVSAHDFGLGTVLMGMSEVGQSLTTSAAITTKYILNYNKGTGKIQLFVDAGSNAPLAELAAAQNVATRIITVRVAGV